MVTKLSSHDRMLRSYTEAEVQQTITDALSYCGWTWHHETDSRKSREGFPDIVAVKGSWSAFLELKRETTPVTPAQAAWLTACAHDRIFQPTNTETGVQVWNEARRLVGVVRPSNLSSTVRLIQQR